MTQPEGSTAYRVDFLTLFIVADWIQAHCVVPDGFDKGLPFEFSDWQLWDTLNHYRVKPEATPGQLSTAFHYRRSQIMRPQKAGKAPWSASVICAEAVGPVLFAGFAQGGERYLCSSHGCRCGWSYDYEPGEPMGKAWPTPLIQISACSEEQCGNIYDALRPMIEDGPLADLIPKTGEEFIRLPGQGRIDVVTSNARSRLGQRVTFVLQDETGLWTKANRMLAVAETQRRGLAGMAGRTMETTNAYDPSENSVGQRTAEAAAADIFKDFPQASKSLSYRDKRERRRIHRHVYAGCPWVDLDAIEAEAAELIETDPGQAERFFGNRVVAGLNAYMPLELWERSEKSVIVPDGTQVSAGFDGSENNDWTAIRAETIDGHRFTPLYGPDRRPTIWNPAEWGGQIPRPEVHAAWDEINTRYRLKRAYCDPQDWRSEIGDWAQKYGDRVFFEWATYRLVPMHEALKRSLTDLSSERSTHDGCQITALHVANARKLARPGQRYLLGKPNEHQKIDAAMADVLAHEAAADAHVDGWGEIQRPAYFYSA